ncbi:uncharacterized protein PFL1_01909 [Pseudozyma flocculosa PF-1]|uniref:uncharacterized protein n=1 Tax=Pseudozyma flocculosa PF-1 TaxID=1277687 RepID=UPI0004560ECF|nr:uncharacterized protein PFL1_01909 [Pseudozyma flocculosa PF-1]EPQ30383.1 hypothetical protein PFL1_01909 [Pseudozyma flocculosa PF-1]
MITLLPLSVPYATASDAAVRTTLKHHDPSTKTAAADDDDDAELEQPKALAYLLQIDDIRVLIDCGAPEDFLFAPVDPSAAAAKPSKIDGDDSDASSPPAESSAMAQGRADGQQQKQQQEQRHKDLETLASGPLDQILAQLAPTIDLVLLSHSSLSHLGLYAYAYARLGLRCLVYATMPVQSMGKLTVTEAVEAWRTEVDIDRERTELEATGGLADRRCIPTLDEVDEAFEAIKTVRYLQPTHLEGKCTGITLTAYNAGHALGGAVWKLRSPTSGTVLIALDWNHNRERHLDGTALLASSGAAAPSAAGGAPSGISDAVRRPDLLITEIQRGLVVNVRRKDRDAALLDLVHKTIQGGHSVLFPVDPSARLLELLVLLDQHWAYAYPHARFPLCLVSRTGKEVLERSRTYMEWMTREWATKAGEAATEEAGEGARGARGGGGGQGNRRGKGAKSQQAPISPLDFKFLKVFPTLAALDEAVPRDQAKVVLAVPPSMTHGPSRRLFARFAENPNDLVVLLQRGQPGSLSRHLWDVWSTSQDDQFRWTNGKLGSAVSPPQVEVEFELKSKVPLEGDELRAHLEAEQAEKEKQAQQRALLARSRRRLEADEDDESDSDDDDDDDDDDDEDDRDGAGKGAPVGKIAGGGFAEPGSMGRKRNHALAFDESGGRGGAGGAAGAGGGLDDGANGDAATQVSFDIYLKGNASRATTFFGSKVGGAGQEGPFGVGVRYRLFPVVERKRRIDGYGETIDVARWLSRRKEIEGGGGGTGTDALGEANTGDDKTGKRRRTGEVRAQAPAPPSKFITEHVRVAVSCRLAFVEMEGLNDGRALKTLIPQMHPRRLITVNGDAATRRDMLAALQAVKSMTREVYAPALGESVRIGELTNSYAVILGDTLLKGLKMSRVAHLARPTSTALGPTLFVGDLKLSTLKAALSSSSYRLASEFAGEGMLVCGAQNGIEAVTVKKESQGRIVIEGNVGRRVRDVRKAVYELHARV